MGNIQGYVDIVEELHMGKRLTQALLRGNERLENK